MQKNTEGYIVKLPFGKIAAIETLLEKNETVGFGKSWDLGY